MFILFVIFAWYQRLYDVKSLLKFYKTHINACITDLMKHSYFRMRTHKLSSINILEELQMDSDEENFIDQVTIIPPDNSGNVTDTDEFIEDLPKNAPADVPGTIEVTTRKDFDSDHSTDDESNAEDDQNYQAAVRETNRTQKNPTQHTSGKKEAKLPPKTKQNLQKRKINSQPTSSAKTKKSKTEREIKWIRNKEEFEKRIGDEPDIFKDMIDTMTTDLGTYSPYQLFRKFLSDDIIDMLCKESERYARQQNDHTFRVSHDEMLSFIGIHLFSGYHILPRQRMYWEKSDDVHVSLVSNTMTRDRFEKIKKFLHMADNNHINMTDKFAKIRPFLDKINNNLKQFGYFTKNLSADEQMLPYYGRHSGKQYMRNKPVKFGYKLWALASSDGYPYHIIPYGGEYTHLHRL